MKSYPYYSKDNFKEKLLKDGFNVEISTQILE